MLAAWPQLGGMDSMGLVSECESSVSILFFVSRNIGREGDRRNVHVDFVFFPFSKISFEKEGERGKLFWINFFMRSSLK